jgi:hypothetical protein
MLGEPPVWKRHVAKCLLIAGSEEKTDSACGRKPFGLAGLSVTTTT